MRSEVVFVGRWDFLSSGWIEQRGKQAGEGRDSTKKLRSFYSVASTEKKHRKREREKKAPTSTTKACFLFFLSCLRSLRGQCHTYQQAYNGDVRRKKSFSYSLTRPHFLPWVLKLPIFEMGAKNQLITKHDTIFPLACNFSFLLQSPQSQLVRASFFNEHQ